MHPGLLIQISEGTGKNDKMVTTESRMDGEESITMRVIIDWEEKEGARTLRLKKPSGWLDCPHGH